MILGINVSETKSKTDDNVTAISRDIIIDRDIGYKTIKTIKRTNAHCQSGDAGRCTENCETKKSTATGDNYERNWDLISFGIAFDI